MRYTIDDLKIIDPVEHVRSHPEMYLPQGTLDGSMLASRIVGDVLMLSDGWAYALHAGDWWIVASEIDWIQRILGSEWKDYFQKIVPFPEAGQNAMHSGVLLIAFAQDLMTFDEVSTHVIRGEADPSELEVKVREAPQGWKRAIAFRLPVT
ncbi:hypothetical protein V5E97_26135 [Singulisphaera sp. Ch08]|uniref:Uncharacterized protein n=1 Tax=Singulisphaera sp. Ch08 TaxID=3120278 RepID=A0AAU7C8U4_9BACT